MQAVDGCYHRPLLGLRHTVPVAACRALGLEPWDDPQNADPRYQRVRLRREVLPLLDDILQGGVAEALARTGELLRDDLDALDGWAAAVLGQLSNREEVGVDALAALPRAVRTRVLRGWMVAAGAGPLTAERTERVDELLTGWHGQGPVDLPGGIAVLRRSARLVIQPSPRAQRGRA
jgi:tRNA(Ile)-lysidine synthase